MTKALNQTKLKVSETRTREAIDRYRQSLLEDIGDITNPMSDGAYPLKSSEPDSNILNSEVIDIDGVPKEIEEENFPEDMTVQEVDSLGDTDISESTIKDDLSSALADGDFSKASDLLNTLNFFKRDLSADASQVDRIRAMASRRAGVPEGRGLARDPAFAPDNMSPFELEESMRRATLKELMEKNKENRSIMGEQKDNLLFEQKYRSNEKTNRMADLAIKKEEAAILHQSRLTALGVPALKARLKAVGTKIDKLSKLSEEAASNDVLADAAGEYVAIGREIEQKEKVISDHAAGKKRIKSKVKANPKKTIKQRRKAAGKNGSF